MPVVVVESPAKAKTINKYLGSDYTVLASYGHVRDLPPKDGSVRPDEDFAMSWQVDTASAKRLTEISKAVKEADSLFLATDPDREGEAISWHVLEVLKQKRAIKDKPVRRVVFNAITKNAVLDAMAQQPPPHRLVLGSAGFDEVIATFEKTLADLRANETLSRSADFTQRQ